jgi:hypothetical protein
MPRQEVNTHHGRIGQVRDPVNPRQWRQAYVHGKFGDVRFGSKPDVRPRSMNSGELDFALHVIGWRPWIITGVYSFLLLHALPHDQNKRNDTQNYK